MADWRCRARRLKLLADSRRAHIPAVVDDDASK